MAIKINFKKTSRKRRVEKNDKVNAEIEEKWALAKAKMEMLTHYRP